jgi:hypothetical protein
MTKLNLDLTNRQIYFLFESLETLKSYYKTINAINVEKEVTDLIRYLDSKVCVENE